jgi:uncharacterized OB-fold protein
MAITDAWVSQGWQCPVCKSVYSPTTPMCFTCPPKTETVVKSPYSEDLKIKTILEAETEK